MTAGLLRMGWARFAAFAAAAGIAWASYAALVGFIGGRAFQDRIAAGVFAVVEVARRRARRVARPARLQGEPS